MAGHGLAHSMIMRSLPKASACWWIFLHQYTILVESITSSTKVEPPRMDTVALDQAVTAHLPANFLSSVVRSIFLARKDSYDHCAAEFAAPELQNTITNYWRGKVQGLLRDSAARVPGMTTKVVKASGWNHNEISCGPFTITSPYIRRHLRHGRRRGLQEIPSRESAIFLDPGDMIQGAKLYALILYSPYQRCKDDDDARQYAYLPAPCTWPFLRQP